MDFLYIFIQEVHALYPNLQIVSVHINIQLVNLINCTYSTHQYLFSLVCSGCSAFPNVLLSTFT